MIEILLFAFLVWIVRDIRHHRARARRRQLELSRLRDHVRDIARDVGHG